MNHKTVVNILTDCLSKVDVEANKGLGDEVCEDAGQQATQQDHVRVQHYKVTVQRFCTVLFKLCLCIVHRYFFMFWQKE